MDTEHPPADQPDTHVDGTDGALPDAGSTPAGSTNRRYPGAPIKCTPEVVAKIVLHVSQGQFLAVAARLAGISPKSIHNWTARGKREKTGPFRHFLTELRKAEALNEARLVRQWSKAGKKDWRAAMEMLARRHPERWSPPKDRVEMNAKHSGAIGLEALDDVRRRLDGEGTGPG